MQSFNQSAIKHKLGLLNLAAELGNVSKGCKMMGLARAWINHYNTERTHQGKMCCGRTPMATMLAGKEIYDQKITALN
jgi:hypothetical protein